MAEAHSPQYLRNVREVQSHSELAVNAVSLLPAEWTEKPDPRADREATGRRSGNELLPGRARTWDEVRPQWTACLLPASWALQTLSICTRGLSLGSKWGTALFRAEPGLAVHPRVLPTPPSPASCAPALHPRGPTLESGHPPPLSPAVLPTCTPSPPPCFVILPSFQGMGRIPVLHALGVPDHSSLCRSREPGLPWDLPLRSSYRTGASKVGGRIPEARPGTAPVHLHS